MGDCSEAHRVRCEVETVARWPTDEARADFLENVAKHRGKEAAQKLRRQVFNFMQRGCHG